MRWLLQLRPEADQEARRRGRRTRSRNHRLEIKHLQRLGGGGRIRECSFRSCASTTFKKTQAKSLAQKTHFLFVFFPAALAKPDMHHTCKRAEIECHKNQEAWNFSPCKRRRPSITRDFIYFCLRLAGKPPVDRLLAVAALPRSVKSVQDTI